MASSSSVFKVPPHDLDAEKSVLGAILMDSSLVSNIAEFLRIDHFYMPEHQKIFGGMLALFEKQQPIDLLTLKNELQQQGEIDAAGGSKYLSELINSVPTSAYAEHYAQIIKDRYTKRKLIEMASRTVEKAFDETAEIKMILDSAESDIFALSQQHMHRDFIEIKEILSESFERIEEFSKNHNALRGIPTGFRDLDNKLAGMQPSNLIILAARPGVGKTTFALNIALHIATKDKVPVGFFSLEMSKEELVDRLLVGQADIDAWRLKTGKLTDDDYKRLMEAMGDLSEAPIYIDDTPGLSILEMRTKARKLKAEKNLQLVIVDYLQLADAGRKFESRVQEVSFVSQGLKNLARELKIPVIALSQLSRAVEQRGVKKPQLADLRESGAIEQDADVVMFIYSEEENDELADASKRMMKLSIAKHRNGPVGDIDLMFRGDRVRFFGVEHNNLSI
ncbi:replicative DNA helicase [Candidatus Roizmanbacteria bacterium]|nr:replicative DNA helicase [Candidatus Roizmanbacteria bacterium]